MSDSENDGEGNEPRRSARARKPVNRYNNKAFTKTKNARAKSSDAEDDDEEMQSDNAADDDDDDDASSNDESVAPAAKTRPVGRPRKQTAPAKKPAAAPRKRNANASSPPPAKAVQRRAVVATAGPGTKKGRVAKASGKEELKLNDDCELFNAVKNQDSALEDIAQDWIQEYQDEQEGTTAMGNLITLVLRSCGSNQVVEGDDALDADGIVSYLEDVEEEYKINSHSTYPIISKDLAKVVRSNLQEMTDRLMANAATSQILYDTDFLSIYFAWLESLSSSTVRAFRHTATVISHMTVTALCNVAKDLQESFQLSTRQKEAEEKKARKNSTRIADMEKNLKALFERKSKCEAFMQEMFDTVFVHRYRDADQRIRHDCITDLGKWMKVYPSHFLSGPYLRYVGWMLSDSYSPNRLASLNSLIPLYAKETYTNQLTNFTDRFRDRMVEIAEGDVDLPARISAIHLLTLIDKASMLEEESRNSLTGLIFDREIRVRKAVSSFVASYIREIADERKQIVLENKGKEPQQVLSESNLEEDVLESRLILKCLAEIMIKLESDSGESNSQEAEESDMSFISNLKLNFKSRSYVTVDALWDHLPSLSDWDSFLSYLLVDHTEEVNNGSMTKLSDAEETHVLNLFQAAVTHQQVLSNSPEYCKKHPDETGIDDYTRALIKVLPSLCSKNQMDPARLIILLSIPATMNLGLYLDMKMIGSYATLWDWVIAQFLSQSRPQVLSACVFSIMSLMKTSSLNETNEDKILALEAAVITNLQSTFSGLEDNLEETEKSALTASLHRIRLYLLAQPRSSIMDQTIEGNVSCSQVARQISERGASTISSTEISLISSALQLRFAELASRLHAVVEAPDLLSRGNMLPSVKVLRNALWDDVRNLAQSVNETSAQIRTVCYDIVFSLATVFNPRTQLGSLIPLKIDEEEQARSAGFISSQLEQYEEEIASREEENSSLVHGKELKFAKFLSSFTRAIRAESLDLDTASYILPYFGRLGNMLDAAMNPIFDKLKDDALYNKRSEEVSVVMIKTLKLAFQSHQEDPSDEKIEQLLKLSRALAAGCVQRGAQLKVIGSIDSKFLYQVHLDCIKSFAPDLSAKEQCRDIFKLLLPLLGTGPISLLSPGHAAQLKLAYEKVLEDASVLPDSEDTWDSWRLYDKRLRAISMKATGTLKETRKQAVTVNADPPADVDGVAVSKDVPPRSRSRDQDGDENLSDSAEHRPSKRQRSVGPEASEELHAEATEAAEDVEMGGENDPQEAQNLDVEGVDDDDVDSVFGDTIARGGRILAGLSATQD